MLRVIRALTTCCSFVRTAVRETEKARGVDNENFECLKHRHDIQKNEARHIHCHIMATLVPVRILFNKCSGQQTGTFWISFAPDCAISRNWTLSPIYQPLPMMVSLCAFSN